MSKLIVSRHIEADPRQVWNVIADFGGVEKFHPYVTTSPLQGTSGGGVGAERICHFRDGNQILERVIGWDEGRAIDIELVEGTMPLETAKATLSVAPGANGGAEVSMLMDFTPKFGLIGRAMDALVMRRQFRRILNDVLRGLEQHLRTGEVVNRENLAA